jgi:hypothetical protein
MFLQPYEDRKTTVNVVGRCFELGRRSLMTTGCSKASQRPKFVGEATFDRPKQPRPRKLQEGWWLRSIEARVTFLTSRIWNPSDCLRID